jgi:hypothetical protein
VHLLAVVLATATVSAGDQVVVRTMGAVAPAPVRIYLSNSVGLGLAIRLRNSRVLAHPRRRGARTGRRLAGRALVAG